MISVAPFLRADITHKPITINDKMYDVPYTGNEEPFPNSFYVNGFKIDEHLGGYKFTTFTVWEGNVVYNSISYHNKAGDWNGNGTVNLFGLGSISMDKHYLAKYIKNELKRCEIE